MNWTAIRDYFNLNTYHKEPAHTHLWEVVSVAHFDNYEMWWGQKYLVNQYTVVVSRCTVCGTIRQNEIDGHHELKNLQKVSPQSTESDDTDDGKL